MGMKIGAWRHGSTVEIREAGVHGSPKNLAENNGLAGGFIVLGCCHAVACFRTKTGVFCGRSDSGRWLFLVLGPDYNGFPHPLPSSWNRPRHWLKSGLASISRI